MSAGYYARFVCRARLHWLSVLSPDCVSRTAFRPDGVFPPLTPARTGALGKRLGDRFSKQAGHEYASSPHKHPGGGGMLDLDETENKQFCHIQAAALTLWAFSARPSLPLQFTFPDVS